MTTTVLTTKIGEADNKIPDVSGLRYSDINIQILRENTNDILDNDIYEWYTWCKDKAKKNGQWV